MTYTSSNGASASNKSLFIQSQISAIALEAGLVRHPLVSATDQVLILREIDLSGNATVGEVMEALDGHADPVGAILSLIKAGVIAADLKSGILDENALLTRAGHPYGSDPDPAAPGGAVVPHMQEDPLDADEGTIAWPEQHDGQTPGTIEHHAVVSVASDNGDDPLPEGLALLPLNPLRPRVHVGRGDARRSFASLKHLQRAGVYILLSDTSAYVGVGSVVGRRVASGAQPIEDVDTIITITDENDGLDDADAAALERLLHMRVSAAKEVRLVNGTPGGAVVTPERYDQLNAMAGLACDALARDGHLFVNMSRRLALAGPRAERGQLAPLRPFDNPPEGEVFELSFGRNLIALAARQADDDWLLLAGSDIRLDTVASANASASYLRAAWLSSGLLELSDTGEHYVLTRDIAFRSGSGAMHFVLGSKGQGRGGWQAIDPDLDLDIEGGAPDRGLSAA